VERAENVDTFTTQDTLRRKFTEAPPGSQGAIKDFDITQVAAGDWLNYTRTYPSGTFAIYLRARGTAPQQVTLSRVSNASSSGQTATVLGSFNVMQVPLGWCLGLELRSQRVFGNGSALPNFLRCGGKATPIGAAIQTFACIVKRGGNNSPSVGIDNSERRFRRFRFQAFRRTQRSIH
jgi:hypothetical protein